MATKLTQQAFVCLMCVCEGHTGTKNQASIRSGADSFNVALFMLIAFSFVPAAWISFIVREKETKCKHQQVKKPALSRGQSPGLCHVYRKRRPRSPFRSRFI